jgi:uncharacterized membrane protein
MNSRTHISESRPDIDYLRLMNSIVLFAFAGIAISSVSLYHHFGSSTTGFCTFGKSFNCDLVNRSQYSTVLGLPVALIGICGYVLILLLATVYRNKAETRVFLAICSTAGLAFSLYLTYIEKFILSAWCILCLSSLVIIFVVTLLSAGLTMHASRQG